MPFEEYLEVAGDQGFTEIHRHDVRGTQDVWVALWHADGLLLTLESFTWGDGRVVPNSARLGFCVQTTPDVYIGGSFSPVRWDEHSVVRLHDMDVRVGLGLTLGEIRSKGQVLPTWPWQGWDPTWMPPLLDREESRSEALARTDNGQSWAEYTERRRAAQTERARSFPEHVRQALGVPDAE